MSRHEDITGILQSGSLNGNSHVPLDTANNQVCIHTHVQPDQERTRHGILPQHLQQRAAVHIHASPRQSILRHPSGKFAVQRFAQESQPFIILIDVTVLRTDFRLHGHPVRREVQTGTDIHIAQIRMLGQALQKFHTAKVGQHVQPRHDAERSILTVQLSKEGRRHPAFRLFLPETSQHVIAQRIHIGFQSRPHHKQRTVTETHHPTAVPYRPRIAPVVFHRRAPAFLCGLIQQTPQVSLVADSGQQAHVFFGRNKGIHFLRPVDSGLSGFQSFRQQFFPILHAHVVFFRQAHPVYGCQSQGTRWQDTAVIVCREKPVKPQ